MMMLRKHTYTFITALSFLFITLTACDESVLYHTYRSVDPHGWRNTDTLDFEVPCIQEDTPCQLALALRYNERFPYESLWMAVECLITDTLPLSPPMVIRDTVECELLNPQTLRTEAGIHLYQYCTPFDTLSLKDGQTIRIRCGHLMRRENIPGISDVGMLIKKCHSN